MKLIELIIDENDELNGIEAISVVESPAIESDFIVIKPSIVCVLDSNFSVSQLTIGDSLNLKGRCVGFDELFMEVKMDHVSFK